MPENNKPKKVTEPFGFVGGKWLKEILEKQPDAITEEEKDVLRARRSYLTKSQIKDYGLGKKPKVESPPEEEEESTPEAEEAEEAEENLEDLTVPQLQKVAKDIGVKVKSDAKKKDIIKAIEKVNKKA